MSNQKPAAHRKVGLSAMRTFPLGILLAGLWVYFLSYDTLIDFIAEPNKETRSILVLASAVCFTLWLMFGNRFSPFTLPNKHLQNFATSTLHVFALLLGLANTIFALPSIPAVQDFGRAIVGSGGNSMMVVIAGVMIVALFFVAVDKIVPPKYARRVEWIAGIFAVIVGLFYTSWQTLNFAIIGITIPSNLLLTRYWWMTFMEWGKEHPEYKNLAVFGKGGAARFGGVYSFARYDFSRFMRGDQHMHSPIYMGKSIYYDDPKIGGRHIGLNSQSMMMTIAKPGGGKSLYTAWTELLTWSNGCFVLDPKGEHYMMTGQQRARMFDGQSYAIDPWHKISRTIAKDKIGLMTGADGMRGYINPLDAIDINAVTARDDLMLIVQASIFKQGAESENARFFRESCTKIVLGIMVHVLTRWDKKYHNLPSIFDTFLMGHPDNEQIDHDDFLKLIHEMSGNEALGKAPMEAAKLYNDASPNTRGGFITTITTEFGWVNNKAIRPIISRSNFALSDIKQKKASVYLVIPFEYLAEHRRFSQTIISMGLLSCRDEAEDDRWTLFLLDEFAQLGTFKPVSDGLVTLRGRKVKLHIFLQNIGLLKENYDNWERFMAACDKQYFAVADTKTAEALKEELGDYLERWQEGIEGETRSIDRERPLLTVPEILAFLREGSGNQIVVPTGGNPMRLKLVPFHKLFSGSAYGRVFENDDAPYTEEPRESWEPDADPPAEDPKPYVNAEAEREKEARWEASMAENSGDQSTADLAPDIDLNADLRERARQMGEDTSWFKPEEAKAAQETRDTDELISVVYSDYAYDPERDWAEFYAKFEADLDEEGQQQVLWNIERQKRGGRGAKP